MIYFTRGDYSGPGKVLLNRALPGMSGRLHPRMFVDELRAEVWPHPPVVCGPFAVRSTVVIWLRGEGYDVQELPAGAAPAGAQRAA